MKIVWSMIVLAFLGIAGTVGWLAIEKQKHDAFLAEVVEFQRQTATYEDRVYTLDDTLKAEWTFDPIEWDSPVTMTAIFLFRNTDTDRIYLTGELRILPFFNELQYQVSTPVSHKRDSERVVTTAYHIPPQLEDGNYVIEICQKFDHDGASTAFSCYQGPTFEFETTP